MDGDRILSLEEAAHYLGLKAHALRKRLKAHHGPEFQKVGISAHRIFRIKDLNDYARTQGIVVKPETLTE